MTFKQLSKEIRISNVTDEEVKDNNKENEILSNDNEA